MPKKQSVSVHDIARVAGVSATTVSNCLNGRGNISEATRQRVRAIAKDLGYVPNLAARSLRGAKSATAGIVVPDIGDALMAEVVTGIEAALWDAGYTCYICVTHNDAARETAYLERLCQRQVEGIALVNGHGHPPLDMLPEGLPVLFVDPTQRLDYQNTTYVASDWHAMIGDATRALAAHGCQRIALVNAFASMHVEDDVSVGAFRNALAELGMRLDRNLLLLGNSSGPRAEGRRLVGRCLDEGNRPDGIACLGYPVALGAYDTLRERGLVPGRDTLVINVGGTPDADIISPSLSSLERHADQMAQRGAEALLAMMSGSKPPSREVIIPHEVIERESTLG